MKKYLCIGTSKVASEWLPRWYGVPYEECVMSRIPHAFKTILEKDLKSEYAHLIPLTVIPNGCYKQHLKILKTERLLNGE